MSLIILSVLISSLCGGDVAGVAGWGCVSLANLCRKGLWGEIGWNTHNDGVRIY